MNLEQINKIFIKLALFNISKEKDLNFYRVLTDARFKLVMIKKEYKNQFRYVKPIPFSKLDIKINKYHIKITYKDSKDDIKYFNRKKIEKELENIIEKLSCDIYETI